MSFIELDNKPLDLFIIFNNLKFLSQITKPSNVANQILSSNCLIFFTVFKLKLSIC